MELTIELSGEVLAVDLSGLRGRLLDEPSLRGRVRSRPAPAEEGTMAGPAVDSLLLALAGGGAAAAAARIRVAGSVLVTWLKGRRSDVEVTVSGPNGRSVSFSATNVKSLDSREISTHLDRLARMAEDMAPADGAGAQPGRPAQGDGDDGGPASDRNEPSRAAE